jgi:hypothetical protein
VHGGSQNQVGVRHSTVLSRISTRRGAGAVEAPVRPKPCRGMCRGGVGPAARESEPVEPESLPPPGVGGLRWVRTGAIEKGATPCPMSMPGKEAGPARGPPAADQACARRQPAGSTGWSFKHRANPDPFDRGGRRRQKDPGCVHLPAPAQPVPHLSRPRRADAEFRQRPIRYQHQQMHDLESTPPSNGSCCRIHNQLQLAWVLSGFGPLSGAEGTRVQNRNVFNLRGRPGRPIQRPCLHHSGRRHYVVERPRTRSALIISYQTPGKLQRRIAGGVAVS